MTILSRKISIPEGVTIPEIFLKKCKEQGNIACCQDEVAGSLTYAEMAIRTLILAEKLKRQPGKYIGVLLPAGVAAPIAILAIQLAGKIPLMINWTIGSKHLESVVEVSQVQVILSSKAFVNHLHQVTLCGIKPFFLMLEDLREAITFKEKLKAWWLSKRSVKAVLKHFGVPAKRQDDKAVLLFTSGTESIPKGIPLSHGNILTNIKDCLEVGQVTPQDVFLGVLPPFHAFGLTGSCLFPLLVGAQVVFLPDPTNGKKMAQACEQHKVTVICIAPTFLKRLLKAANAEQLKTLRVFLCGGEKMPSDLVCRLEALGKMDALCECYGITECSPAIAAVRPGSKTKKGLGPALPRVKIKVVHPETIVPLPAGEEGLILVNGPNVFAGYLNPNLESPFVQVEGQQWYKTGDIGFLDAEGNITLTGRLKRFVKVGAEMISLSAIEDALRQAAIQNNWIQAHENGPPLAVVAQEVNGKKNKIVLFTLFSVTVAEANQALHAFGFSNLVKIHAAVQVPQIPLLGSGKVNYRLLEELTADSRA